MTEKDQLQRFIFEHAPVRGEYVHLDDSFLTIVNQHGYPPAIRKLLGEALTVAVLLSAIIKFTGKLTVQFRGKGKLKLLLAQCNNSFQIRGLAKWDGQLTYEELMASFKEGVLVIMLDTGVNGNRYQGIVGWEGDSLTKSIEGYFRDSEQLATKICLNVTENAAAGLLLQIVPGSDKQATGIDKEIIQPSWEHYSRLVKDLNPADLMTLDYESLLRKLFADEEIRIFNAESVTFGCTCSRQRSAEALAMIGRAEAEEELEGKNSIVVTCDFCNKEYIFDRTDVNEIFDRLEKPPSDGSIH